MNITLKRLRETKDSTVGELSIDGGAPICVTLEDGHRSPKVPGETRIPAGRYKVVLRTEGKIHADYLKRFGADFHHGLLHVVGIDGFKYVMIHCGNEVQDTEGCPLTGTNIMGGDPVFRVTESVKAYRKFYPEPRDALLIGEDVFLTVIDPPRPEPLVA